MSYKTGDSLATRKAYGNALKRLYPQFPHLVSLDAEVSNSTYAEIFEDAYPQKFFEMYIAEQNMVGAGLGLATRGKIPFVSTFAAFFSRAFDQIRMSQYSEPNLKFCGSHAGVSIGEDGPSQMGLEDLAMFRAILDSVVLYPADAVSTERLVEEALKHHGIVYIRTTRMGTPIIYGPEEKFPLGGCKVVRQSDNDLVTVIGAGVTLFEALAAYDRIAARGHQHPGHRPLQRQAGGRGHFACGRQSHSRPHHRGRPLSRRRHRRGGHGGPGPQPGAPLCPGGD